MPIARVSTLWGQGVRLPSPERPSQDTVKSLQNRIQELEKEVEASQRRQEKRATHSRVLSTGSGAAPQTANSHRTGVRAGYSVARTTLGTASGSPKPRLDLSGLASPSVRPSRSHRSRTTRETESPSPKRRKVKVNNPDIFKGPPQDVRLWIMEINDFLNLQDVTDTSVKAATAISYLGEAIKKRTQLLRLNGLKAIFADWQLTQDWLIENYFSQSAGLDAELRMDRLKMFHDEKIQTFINRFETVLSDLTWNDSAICAQFRKKLSAPIVQGILGNSTDGWPETFSALKTAAQQAEDMNKLLKRARDDRETEEGQRTKRVKFHEASHPINENKDRKNYDRARTTSPNSIPIKVERENKETKPLTEEQRTARRSWREKGLCLTCGEKGHWQSRCPKNEIL